MNRRFAGTREFALTSRWRSNAIERFSDVRNVSFGEVSAHCFDTVLFEFDRGDDTFFAREF